LAQSNQAIAQEPANSIPFLAARTHDAWSPGPRSGRAVERFLGLAHVEDTASLTWKTAIQKMLMNYNLTFAMVRGQGYDGSSNMKGNANGLKN
jgi:hypothetical protein